jgi:hypothetical protein
MALTGAGAAQAEPTGHYEYICVLTDGNSYALSSGAKNTCNGSYLLKYINGQQVDSINLAGPGIVGDPKAGDCALAYTALAVAVLMTDGEAALISLGVGAITTIPPCVF